MIEGFWRVWDGTLLYVLEYDPQTQTVTCDTLTGKKVLEERFFTDKVDVGPIGDMITGFEEPVYVPQARKIVGYNFMRHSGHQDWICPKFESLTTPKKSAI